MITEITLKMKTEIEPTSLSRLDIVKFGRFQDAPTTKGKNIYAAISVGNPEDPNYMDGIASMRDIERIDVKFPVREVGGGEMWYHRGRVQLGCYYLVDQLNEEVAGQNALIVMGRLMQTLKTIRLVGLDGHMLTDEFGESAIKLFVYAYNFFESGGPPKSYIWRGAVHWQVLTEYPIS
jgi:hypothetical protein